MNMEKPELRFLNERLCICRLSAGEAFPAWATRGGFYSVTRTKDEISVVCDEALVPDGVTCAAGYKAIMVQGPLDFSLVGILYSISAALAEAGLSIFALSTYDTDYILVRESDSTAAAQALVKAGYTVL
jgi:hypothetical protein